MKPPDPTRQGRSGNQLVEGPIGRSLITFALPVLGSNVLQSLNGSVNAIWVGRLLGESALTATANGNLVLFLVLGAIFGLGMAATILIAQAIGAGNLRLAKQVVGTGATFFVALSFLLAVLGYWQTDHILALLGTPPDAVAMAGSYLRVLFIAIPVMNFMTFLMIVLRGSGNSRTPFYFMALSVAIDIGFNPLLILGVGPLPQLGIAGAASSTLLAQLVTLTIFLTVIYRRRLPIRLARGEFRYLRPDPKLLALVITKGIPMGLQIIVISASALIVMGLVNAYGSQFGAAYGATSQLWTYVQMPALAIGAAVSTMTAQNVGAGRWDRVRRITAAGVGFNVLMTGATVAVLYLAARPVLGLFLPTDSGAVAIAVHINSVVAWSFVLFGVTIVLFGTVRATGAVVPPLIILFVAALGVRASFAYNFQHLLGADAIWWSFPAGAIVSVVLALAYYRFGGWRRKPMLPVRPPGGEAPETGLGLPRERADAAL